jgi:hypothetical protein
MIFVYQRGCVMRFIVSLLTGLLLLGCRTTKEEDDRFFAEGKSSNGAASGVSVTQKPAPKLGVPLPSPIPNPTDPLEKGAFYRFCVAKNQLTSEQALTVKALLAATHQTTCDGAERWLRDPRNASIMIESEELVELQSLALLQSYPLIRNVYILLARGVEPLCPLALTQICHFRQPEF